MSQQVTVRSNSKEALKPLLESAIRGELKAIQHGINRTRERINAFEARYGLSTEEFQRRFTANDLGESLDFIEWMGELKTLQLLEEKQGALKQAEIT